MSSNKSHSWYFQIEDAVKKGVKTLVDVFPSNHMHKFINHSAVTKEKKAKYPFIFANIDDSSENGTHR